MLQNICAFVGDLSAFIVNWLRLIGNCRYD